MENMQQYEQEKDVRRARIKMIIKYGLAFIAWTVVALLGIGLFIAVVLFLFGVLHL